jgi:hypothetical protein
MNNISGKKATIFICALLFLAVLENGGIEHVLQWHAQIVATAQAKANALLLEQQQRESFLNRYEDTNFVRTSAITTIAVATESDDGTWNSSVSAALVNHFTGKPIHLVSSFFKPAFVSDGLFNEAFGDSSELFDRLELSKSFDGLLLAREQVQYSTTPSLDNLISANIELDVATLPIGSKGIQNRTWTFTSAGSGFTQPEAHKMAEDRIVKQILNETNMTLN